ncbi:MAG: hypothetical protein MUE95_13310 [Cyclobacteriaceae bacterium]|jgi:hypothetical protein|nr:hypothetical protein [Cyclobacteriaceae bacterium]
MHRIICLCLALVPLSLRAQPVPFPETSLGIWKGALLIYSGGQLRDSVRITLTVAKTSQPDEWTWRTEYHSDKHPMTKDYSLRLVDPEKQLYVTDEHNGIELLTYRHGNKLYNVFETQGILLTSTYERSGDKLIFEVTSGKRAGDEQAGVQNYSVTNLQRAVLHKIQ